MTDGKSTLRRLRDVYREAHYLVALSTVEQASGDDSVLRLLACDFVTQAGLSWQGSFGSGWRRKRLELQSRGASRWHDQPLSGFEAQRDRTRSPSLRA